MFVASGDDAVMGVRSRCGAMRNSHLGTLGRWPAHMLWAYRSQQPLYVSAGVAALAVACW